MTHFFHAPVTGLGVFHALGSSVETFWEGLCQGRSPRVDGHGVISLSGTAPGEGISPDRLRRMDRASTLLTVAAKQALADARFVGGTAEWVKIGLCAGTSFGSLDTIVRFSLPVFAQGPHRANPMEFPNTVLNASTGYACMETGLQGYNDTLLGPGALAEAYDALRLGRAQGMMAAGWEEAAVPQRQCHPCLAMHPPRPLTSQDSAGCLGEGAAGLMLAQPEQAQESVAKVYARYAGYAATFDPAPLDARPRSREELVRAIRDVLEKNHLEPDAVDGIISSADGTGDAQEIKALQAVFGERLGKIPLFTPAGALGCLHGAAEAFGALCASLILFFGLWPASPWMLASPGFSLRIPVNTEPFFGHTLLLVVADFHGANYAHLFVKA